MVPHDSCFWSSVWKNYDIVYKVSEETMVMEMAMVKDALGVVIFEYTANLDIDSKRNRQFYYCCRQ